MGSCTPRTIVPLLSSTENIIPLLKPLPLKGFQVRHKGLAKTPPTPPSSWHPKVPVMGEQVPLWPMIHQLCVIQEWWRVTEGELPRMGWVYLNCSWEDAAVLKRMVQWKNEHVKRQHGELNRAGMEAELKAAFKAEFWRSRLAVKKLKSPKIADSQTRTCPSVGWNSSNRHGKRLCMPRSFVSLTMLPSG